MSETKERLVVFLDPKKADKVRAFAKRKKWDITILLEEAVECYMNEENWAEKNAVQK